VRLPAVTRRTDNILSVIPFLYTCRNGRRERISTMTEQPRCFVAYPSSLPAKGDAIEMAVAELNSGGLVRVTSWTSLAINGRPVIGAICQEIDRSGILIADVTNLNPNVLFEIGYAIARRKRLWLLFNPQVAGAKLLFDRFQLLTSIGYSPYNNSRDITTQFYKDPPYKNPDRELYRELTFSTSITRREGSLLYIKPAVSTEAVMRVARRVSAAPLPFVIDDPKEIGVQPIEWYLASVTAARGVICHFLSEDYEDVLITNAKSAFVGGLAFGQEKPLLMLAHFPYNSPIDYKDLLRTHHDTTQAESIYQAWLSPLLEQFGFETAPQKFMFCYDKEQKAKLTILSRKTARLLGKRRLKIHKVFHAYLELKPVDAEGQMPIEF
jgi:hypothetical protein